MGEIRRFGRALHATTFPTFTGYKQFEKAFMDPYEVLGVSREASVDEIRKAYRDLAKKYHPDVNREPEAVHLTARINVAYDMLSDPEKRSAYDNRFGSVEFEVEESGHGEIFVQEYQGHDTIESLENAVRKKERQTRLYAFARILCYPMALFSLIIIVDFFMPVNTELEYPLSGYQRVTNGASVVSFMKTDRYEFKVPGEVHRDYDYNAKEKKLVSLEFTPIFGTLKRIGVDHGEFMLMHRAPGSIYVPVFFPIPYLILILSIVFIRKKEYTKTRYAFCFMPSVMGMIFFVFMFNMQV